ncbi:MAG: hypothetical protein J6U63_04445, partial [Clostridia bacterium]|nr:hypothetical protein [Clostridia bacterium]
GRGVASVAVAAQVIGAQGVDVDHKDAHVRPPRAEGSPVCNNAISFDVCGLFSCREGRKLPTPVGVNSFVPHSLQRGCIYSLIVHSIVMIPKSLFA